MSKKYIRPRGTQDFLPEYMEKWNYVEKIWRIVCENYGYKQIVTPMFENTDLFNRTAGETSDIVTKEMYTFIDKSGRSITLKPEGTASVVRAYFENNLNNGEQPARLFYIMPMFRYERPQAGRFRQHHQYGIECLGRRSPYIDVEIMSLFMSFYKRLGIKEPLIWLNSLGCPTCRKEYKEKLVNYLRSVSNHLCDLCNIRVEKNPLRVLDCKNEQCQIHIHNAPTIVENLCPSCKADYKKVKQLLKIESIPFQKKSTLVRGLDYYNGSVFEVVAKGLSAKDVIAGGGRYDALLKEIGGVDSSAFGAGTGMERLIKTMENHQLPFQLSSKKAIAIISLDSQIDDNVFHLSNVARNNYSSVEFYDSSYKLAKVLKKLNNENISYALIMGQVEFEKNIFLVKNLDRKEQIEFSLDEFTNVIRKIKDNTEL